MNTGHSAECLCAWVEVRRNVICVYIAPSYEDGEYSQLLELWPQYYWLLKLI